MVKAATNESSTSPLHQCEPTTDRLIISDQIRFSEIISALSVALDITQGHPQGHCMRDGAYWHAAGRRASAFHRRLFRFVLRLVA